MTIWKCDKCGNTVDQATPPEVCPSCKEKCDFIDVSCYTPDCGGPGSGNIDPALYRPGKKD
ncbi:MAG: rubredoxin-like domain-containing protein [Acidobacteriota bacterium]